MCEIFRAAVSNKEILLLAVLWTPHLSIIRFIRPSEFTLAPMKYQLKGEAEEAKRKVNSTRLSDPISDELRQCSKKSTTIVVRIRVVEIRLHVGLRASKTVESTDQKMTWNESALTQRRNLWTH